MRVWRCLNVWVAVLVLCGATPAPPVALGDVLASHLHALGRLGVSMPRTFAAEGTLEGLALHGTFRTWRDGDRERYDQTLGVRSLRTLRVAGRTWVQNASGDVRELHGLVSRRQTTEDFIDSGDFARHPEDDVLLGSGRLRDGREVWRLRVAPPGGEPFGVALDARTWMVDEKAYLDGDALRTFDYDDYAVAAGALYPRTTVESSGDRAFDLTSRVTHADAGRTIADAVFAPLVPVTIDVQSPVTLALLYDEGHVFVRGRANGRDLLLLVDSGSQAVVFDVESARALGLTPEGTLEIRGAKRTAGAGVAALDRIELGPASLPVNVVSIVDLSAVTYRGIHVDGVLGYPLFAAAEVRIDPIRPEMTLAKPGMLAVQGSPVPVDTDRELPEITARVNDRVDGRFLVDTGNSSELLLFHAFLDAHPGLVFYGGAHAFVPNRGVGGSSAAVAAWVDRLQIGPFSLYNRKANVMLAERGAFADGNDAGNVGLETLKSFVVTFDLARGTLYLDKASTFDDGRYRAR